MVPRDERRPIVLSQHAWLRLHQRKIQVEEVERAVRAGAWRFQGPEATDHTCEAWVNGETLVLAIAALPDRIVVKTVLPLRRR